MEVFSNSSEEGAFTDVAVGGRPRLRLRVEKGVGEAGLNNGADRADGTGLNQAGSLAGRLHTNLALGLLQGQYAQAVAEALLGVRPVGHDRL